MKVGIDRDLRIAGTGLSRERRIAMARYVGSPGYLANICEGTPRIDLNGEPASTVTGELCAIAKALEPRRPAKRQAAPPTPEPPAAPERQLGLSDLKAAWQARQTAKHAAE